MHFIDLRISSETIKANEISELLVLKPDKLYDKGDISFYQNKKIEYQETCWIKGVEIHCDDDIEEAINSFLSHFIPHVNAFDKLRSQTIMTLWISLYPEKEQMNIHVSPSIIEKISKLGISIDFTVMSLQSFYDGTYNDAKQ